MKKSIVAACVAALSFGGCAREQSRSTRAEEPKAAVARAARGPLPVNPLDAGSELGRQAAAAPTPEQGLGLAHEQPKVDHLARARSLRETGDLGGALTEARRAIYTDPEDSEAITFAARTASLIGQHALAADAWAALCELRSDDAAPRIQEARTRLRALDLVGATVAARDAIERDPGAPEAYQVLGRAALARGEVQQAIDAFSKVVELAPEHGHGLNNLGFAYLRANQNEEAVEVLARAAGLLPNVAYVHNNLGIALERVGRTEEAKHAYLAATALSPKYVKARVNMNRVAKVAVPPEPAESKELEASPSSGEE